MTIDDLALPPLPVEGDRETGSLFNENPRDEVRLDENRRAVRVSPLPVEGDRAALIEMNHNVNDE